MNTTFRFFAGGLLCLILFGCRDESSTKTSDSRESGSKPTHTPINLQPRANHPLNQPPKPRGPGNHLAGLPTGRLTLNKVPFVVGPNYVQLGSRSLRGMPLKVDGIAVDRPAKRLHFLHAVAYSGANRNPGSGQKDGTSIGKYVVGYTDGSRVEIPLRYGEQVRDWWNWDNSKPVTDATVAWEGENSYARRFGVRVRLFLQSWDNPHLAKKIASLAMESANDRSALMCIAVTTER